MPSMQNRKVARPTAKAITLPTRKTIPSNNLAAYTILIYGREKIGKTTLIAEFPEVLFIATEPGTKNLAVYEMRPADWNEFVQIVDLLEKEPSRFQNVAIDTADLLYDMCERAVCRRMGIEHPGDEDYGKGWSAVRTEFMRQIIRLQNMNRGLIFLSHAQSSEIRGRPRPGQQQPVHDMTHPTMSRGARRVIEPMVDIWGYYEYAPDGTRRLWLQGNDQFSAGNRLQGRFLNAKTGKQFQYVSMGGSAQEAYRNFVSAFENKFSDTAKTPVSQNKPANGASPQRQVVRRVAGRA